VLAERLKHEQHRGFVLPVRCARKIKDSCKCNPKNVTINLFIFQASLFSNLQPGRF
jgi:hypothetical protein